MMRTRLAISLRILAVSAVALVMIPADTMAKALLQAAGGLVGYYAADGDAGTTATDGSGTQNGAYQNGATFSTAVTPPAVPAGNTSTIFINGGLVNVPHNATQTITGTITLAAWIHPTGTPNNQMCIIEKWTSGTSAINGYFLRLGRIGDPATGHHLKFSLGDGTNQPEKAEYGVAIPLNVWTHVAATYDGTNMRIYKNGAAIGTALPAGLIGNAIGASIDPLHLGVDYGNNRFMGHIDEARIYNRALSAAEIGVLINGQAAPTNLVATPGVNMVDLSWTAAAGATSYIVQVGPSSTGPWTTIGTPTGTTFTDMNAVWPNTYWYRVIAVSAMQSAPAGPVSATPQSPLPRFNDHEEGLFDDNCNCASTAPAAGSWALAFGLLALLAIAPLLRR